ncbi:hypothetical protein BWGOE13_38230 [Bacillus mycoides]|uniref:Tail spike domain-containing protein n=1 Tax=Bacillus mycoides TaxID=1405 RepID=A0A1E8BJ05_BACMY|nr:phage tail spike protein [Bacillus mycoides]OFD89232.1 hypothetical protein BWGOE11_38960 [Bacillus mycoides]OFD95017.1 hypothetical protein BWGOE13_38230 [Bacillus mycoides]
MRTPSGILHVVDFKTEQIVANIQTKDYWDDKRHWEIKNNIDTLEFRVFDNTDHAATLMQQNLVLKEVRDGRIVPYVITEAEKDSNDRSVIAYASGEWIQLAKAGIIPPQKIEGKTVMEMVDIALSGTKWKKGNIEYASFRSMTIDEFIDPLSFLKKIASLFELEIQYRAEVVGSQIVGRYVDMVKKRGQETGKEVTLGKDLVGIKRVENSQNICTSLVGFVKKEGDTIITVESINNGLPYIVDSDAFQRWHERGHHKFGFYTPETEEDITPQRLMTLMKTELAKRVNTSVSYEVQAQSIGRIFGLAHELINEGDTIRIKDTGFTPKLYLEARAIAGDESFTDPSQDKYVFGDYREITDPNEELRKIYNRILSSLGNKQEMLDQLDKLVKEANETASNAKKESEAAKTLALKVQDNLKNYQTTIIDGKTAPTTGLEPGKTLWLDLSNGKPGILKKWNGSIWESVVPDVESVKKETLEQVTKDINNTKQELDKKVETLKTETETLVNTQIKEVQATLNDKVAAVKKDTETISGEIVTIKKDIESKIDGNFVKEQIKDKADKAGVFTKDEIREGFIGKQIYETDKSGNVKKFQEISTSVEQTNESIKHLATKQSVTDLGNNITQVSKTANEAKQTAEGNTRIITQVDSKVKQTAEDFNKKTTVIEETVNGITKNVTNIQTEQGKISERVTKSEQTADGFKQSIESLNKADGTISNKLNTVEKTVEGTKKTIADIQSEANALKKTTNEIKETADGTKQTLTELKTIVDNTKSSGDNSLRETSFNSLDYWTRNGNGKFSIDQNKKWQEQNSLLITTDKSDYDGVRTDKYTIPFKQNAEYILSFYLYIEKQEDITKDLRIYIPEYKGNQLVTYHQYVTIRPGMLNLNEWTLFTVKLKTRDGNRFSGLNIDFVNKTGTSKVWLALPCLREGNTFVPWSPNPDDNRNEFTKKTVEIETSIKGINTTVSNVLSEQGKISERVTKSEQTAGGFKTSIESLTKKDNDISNKLNTVEQTVEGTKKTISDVQQTTNDLKKTTTEIKEQAGKVTEKLSSVEKKFDDMEIGGRNLILNSKINETSSNYGFGLRTTTIDLVADETYTLVGNGRVDQKAIDDGKSLLIYIYEPTWKYKNINFSIKTTTDSTGSIQFTPNWSGKYIVASYLYPNGGSRVGKATTNWVALYKGNKPMDWMPAPEDQVTTDEFTKKTTEIEKSVEGVKTTVTNVQNSQVGFEKRMSNVEQTASGLSSTVSNLNNVVSDQGKKITDANTKIEQQAQAIKAKVEIKQVEDYVGGFKIPELKNTVTKNKQDLIEEIAKKVATQDYNKKTTELERLISANAQGISLAAIKTEVYTKVQADGKYADKAYVEKQAARIDLTEKNILSTVQKGDIISAINQTAEKITIDVAKLNINADTVVKWLTAKGIDADVIKISGDKVTIDKNGVTVKMANFLYEDEFGKKYSVMPKKNLIADHMFSSISCYLPTNNMRRIMHSPEWKITGEPYIEDNYTNFGYEQMINAMRINIQHWIRYPLFSGVKRGKKYTLSAHFRAATYNGNVVSDYPRLRVITGHFAPDGRPVEDLRFEKVFDAPGKNIVRYSNTFTIPDNFPDNGFCYFDIYGAGDYGSNMAVCVSGVQLVEGELPAVYNWDTTIDNIASGYTPVQSLSIGNRDTFLGYGVTSPEFRISTNADVHFNRKVSTYGVNVGGQAFGSYGSIFYVNGASGWSFYTMGIDGNWKTWNGI